MDRSKANNGNPRPSKIPTHWRTTNRSEYLSATQLRIAKYLVQHATFKFKDLEAFVFERVAVIGVRNSLAAMRKRGLIDYFVARGHYHLVYLDPIVIEEANK